MLGGVVCSLEPCECYRLFHYRDYCFPFQSLNATSFEQEQCNTRRRETKY